MPALTIGAQPLRGFSETDWTAYLDAASYPRESKLPRNWPQPQATPLVERVAPGTSTARTPTVPSASRNADPPAQPASGVRF